MSSVSKHAGEAEALSPKAQAIMNKCISEVGVVLVEISARIAAEDAVVAA